MRFYSVSKVAAVIGKNPYENTCDIFETMWKKENKDSYYGSVKRLKPTESYANDQDLIYTALRTEEVKNIVEDCKKSTDITNTVTTVENTETKLDEKSAQLVKKHIKSRFSTQYGTKSEQSALDLYAQQTEQNVQKYHVMLNKKINDEITIRGKIDGIIKYNDNTCKVVEIKNRTRRLFNEVKEYENIQVQLYLNMLNAKNADLVEHYKGNLNISPIEYDATLYDEIKVLLTRFDDKLSQITDDKDFQYQYFNSPDRSDFILLSNI